MNEDEWAEKYRPEENPYQPGSNLFDTFGPEYDYVVSRPIRHVWTMLGDDEAIITPGVHVVNRIGFFVTEVPWADDDEFLEIPCD